MGSSSKAQGLWYTQRPALRLPIYTWEGGVDQGSGSRAQGRWRTEGFAVDHELAQQAPLAVTLYHSGVQSLQPGRRILRCLRIAQLHAHARLRV